MTQGNVFLIESEVTSDCPTPISLTHHGYFNLAGAGNIFGHELVVYSDRAFLVDELMTPLGRTEVIAGGARDFSSPRRLGEAIPHLFEGHGDCYVLPGGDRLSLAASLLDPVTGRSLEVSTNDYCLQTYTAAKLDCAWAGKSGQPYRPFAGLCLECEGYPAGVDFPEFGSIIVSPGQPQRRATCYAFSTN